MSNFIALSSHQPEAVARYKREVRAIVVDRAADHIDKILPHGRKPSTRSYDKAFEEGLLRAKLDVMAELFRIMHDLARANAVAAFMGALLQGSRDARALAGMQRGMFGRLEPEPASSQCQHGFDVRLCVEEIHRHFGGTPLLGQPCPRQQPGNGR